VFGTTAGCRSKWHETFVLKPIRHFGQFRGCAFAKRRKRSASAEGSQHGSFTPTEDSRSDIVILKRSIDTDGRKFTKPLPSLPPQVPQSSRGITSNSDPARSQAEGEISLPQESGIQMLPIRSTQQQRSYPPKQLNNSRQL
jgi:hypothetical protein